MMLTNNKYNLKDKVYLSTNIDQKKRIITGICFRQSGFQYELTCGEHSSWHYEFEISIEKDVLIGSE